MNVVILMTLLAVTGADYAAKTITHVQKGPILVRAPAHDSAIIQSHRLGGNFAYSTHEAHAYAEQKPIIGHRTVPVGVSYQKGEPVVHSTTKYVTAKVPQVGYGYPSHSTSYGYGYPSHSNSYGYGYPSYSNSYDSNDYGDYAAPAYSNYGNGQASIYGQYAGAAPAYSYGVATDPAYSYGLGAVAPAYSYGVTAATPAYSYGVTAAAPAYSYGVPAVAPAYSYGVSDNAYDQKVVVPAYGHETHGHDNNYDQKVVVPAYGHETKGHATHYQHETPVYTQEYSHSYAPHHSYSPVHPHKVETHTTIVKGHKYGKHH